MTFQASTFDSNLRKEPRPKKGDTKQCNATSHHPHRSRTERCSGLRRILRYLTSPRYMCSRRMLLTTGHRSRGTHTQSRSRRRSGEDRQSRCTGSTNMERFRRSRVGRKRQGRKRKRRVRAGGLSVHSCYAAMDLLEW